jgi:uncharacterized protein YndB with AHSA1/START domain
VGKAVAVYGTVEELGDGRWRLRFTRDFAHPVDRVWRAVTEREHLAAWFPTTIDGDRAPGALLTFVFPEGRAPPMAGTVVVCEPCSVFEFRWGAADVIRLEVLATEDGTRLTLTHTFREHGKAARDAAGWHVCLDALSASLAGRDASGNPMDRWNEVRLRYAEQFGPAASTVGPPRPPA